MEGKRSDVLSSVCNFSLNYCSFLMRPFLSTWGDGCERNGTKWLFSQVSLIHRWTQCLEALLGIAESVSGFTGVALKIAANSGNSLPLQSPTHKLLLCLQCFCVLGMVWEAVIEMQQTVMNQYKLLGSELLVCKCKYSSWDGDSMLFSSSYGLNCYWVTC